MISLSERNDGDRFVSIHFIGVPLSNNRYMITRSGVALVELEGTTTEDWTREELHLTLDLRDALERVQPRPPRQGFEWALQFEQWAPIAGLNAIFNQNVSNNSGHAVDTFRLLPAPSPRTFLVLACDLAVRDSDARLHRVGYYVTLVGTLAEINIVD